ncbi:metal ion transporter, NRAMP family [Sulfobacillus acidophilus DSM 10332]|uniref:Metal ion transporter, NRAMP family n=1 Tax=Sulfobacillus acidophilus (strain ATCC 700253 / DSM 10332 / NAL) TaxID=679936 RepID=G8TS29_SULAD|nr:metal ion transporter, NRAMP family [Sulfobacillus acidophilus DSM 10332]
MRADKTPDTLHGSLPWYIPLLAIWGPGLMVMLADTDAGSLITAAQSGAEWGYHMILPQLILIPVLYIVQEVTVRLGIVTGQGHGSLIRQQFGGFWAIISATTLFLSAVGALITEFSGVAGVGALFGVPPAISVGLATVALIAIGLSGSYLRVERIGVIFGLFELVFVGVAVVARPSPAAMAAAFVSIPLTNLNYLFLLAANVGAVIMPWMIFYQQGAVIDKGLTRRWRALRHARWDTLAGSIITQVIMMAMVIVVAATVGRVHAHRPLNTVQQISQSLVPFLGHPIGITVFGLGMLGASIIAALVVSVAGAWGLGEVFGFSHSLNHSFREAPWFYAVYSFAHIAGAVLVIFSRNLVSLTIDVEIMNAMLLPIVLGFLLALEARALPPRWRMRGFYRWLVWGVSAIVMLFGLLTIVLAV